MAHIVWAAWHYGREDPYAMFNEHGAEPSPHPERVRTFIAGCALYSVQFEQELAGFKVQRKGLG